jgi:hypothetical protein
VGGFRSCSFDCRSGSTTPLLIELFHPRSVVDLGCGTGIWLAAFREQGVTDVLGIEGAWVPRLQRVILEELFLEHDLMQTLRQGGLGHIKEQWPSYWVQLFATFGYECLIGLRRRLWFQIALEVWYRHNILCFAPPHAVRVAAILGIHGEGDATLLDVVHPDLFLRIGRYNIRLERDLQQSRYKLDKITSSTAWRLYQTLRPGWTAIKRATAYLRPKKAGQ